MLIAGQPPLRGIWQRHHSLRPRPGYMVSTPIARQQTALQVFFVDSLKFFLSLYGHKLPVLSMDISSGEQI